LNPNPTKFGDKDPTTVACRQKLTTCEITKMMAQMMGIRLLFQETPFSGQLTLKKWLIEYFNPNIPSNDPSDSEYSRK
jgi:hypothetical protein